MANEQQVRAIARWIREESQHGDHDNLIKNLFERVAAEFHTATSGEVRAAAVLIQEENQRRSAVIELALKIIDRVQAISGLQNITVSQATEILGVNDPDVVALLASLDALDIDDLAELREDFTGMRFDTTRHLA